MNTDKIILYGVVFYCIVEIISIKKYINTLTTKLNTQLYESKLIEHDVKQISENYFEIQQSIHTLNTEMLKTNKFNNLLDYNTDSDYSYIEPGFDSDSDSDFIDI